jgi:hypothetical protein
MVPAAIGFLPMVEMTAERDCENISSRERDLLGLEKYSHLKCVHPEYILETWIRYTKRC